MSRLDAFSSYRAGIPSHARAAPVPVAPTPSSCFAARLPYPTRVGKGLRPQRATTISRASLELGREVQIVVEKPSGNVRILKAGVEISAPADTVWSILTDYDNLGNFVPSLVQNECLERAIGGCKLMQVGAQDVAFGMKFSAKVVLECTEFPSGLGFGAAFRPTVGCLGGHIEGIPEPATPYQGRPCKDIAFTMVEGDFQCFTGVWRIQDGAGGPGTCRLSYSVVVSPMAWLPVALIQNRIERDIANNLRAVSNHAEKTWSMQKA